MSMATNSDFVSLPVRTELLPAVLRLLADQEEARSRDTSPTPIPAGGVTRGIVGADEASGRASGTPRSNAGRVWSDGEYRRLLDEKTTSAERVRQIMNAMLVHGAPAGRVSTSQLATETGLKETQIRAALSWLTRFMRANGEQFMDDKWPFGWAVGRQVDPENPTEFHYEMSEEQAAGWLMHLGPDIPKESLVNDELETDADTHLP